MGFLTGLTLGFVSGVVVMLVSLALVRYCKIDDYVEETRNNMQKIGCAEKNKQ